MSDGIDRTVLPIRRPPFTGVAGKTLGESQPDWGLIGHAKPPARAPNVLLVLIDDGRPVPDLRRAADRQRHRRI
jgi:hypothetical protein